MLAIEDDRFYEHGGVDMQGLFGALVSNVTSGTNRGASTITQQYVNNVIIDTNLQQRRGSRPSAAARRPSVTSCAK